MAKEDLLRSWKDISTYLEVNARTCRRWEKDLGLPIHRIHSDSKRSPVFAYASELDLWLAGKPISGQELEKEKMGRRLRLRTVFWATAGLAVIAASAAFFKFFPISPSQSSPKNLSIAVMPFKNLKASTQDDYLSEGITHEIINDLSLFSNVRVLSALDSPEVIEKASRVQMIRSNSGVDYLLKGALQRNERMLHLDVEIVRLRDNAKILNLRLDEDLDKPFTIVNSVCQKISETLRLSRDSHQRAFQVSPSKTIPNGNAVDSYMKGCYILNRLNNGQEDDRWNLYHQGKFYWGQFSRESNELAIQMFSQALALDETFGQAYIGLASCYVNYINLGWDNKEIWLDKAEELTKKAQSINPDLPEYYCSMIKICLLKDLGFGADKRAEAYRLADEGVKRYPDHPQLNADAGSAYFVKFGETGKDDDFQNALKCKEKSYSINPYPFYNIAYTELLALNRQFEKAISICNLLLGHGPAGVVQYRLGEIYYYMGDLERCKTTMEGIEYPQDLKVGTLFYLGMIAAQQGDAAKVEEIIKNIQLLVPIVETGSSTDNFQLASMYMGIGEKEKGYHYLDRFFSQDLTKKIPYICKKNIDIDKNFDTVKDEARFCQIVERRLTKWPRAKQFESLQISKNASKS